MKEKIKCPKCNSSMVYIRLKSKEIVCRSCGSISEVENNGEK